MAKQENEKIVVGLDIGTTKVCCVIGEVDDNGGLSFIGIGHAVSRGLKKGIVVDVETTVEAVRKAVDEASRMAGVEVASVFAGIAGSHVKGLNTEAVVAVAGKNKEVTKGDVERVIEAVTTQSVPPDREVIHIIPQEFILDEQDEIRAPVGMYGQRLRAKVHVVTASGPRTQDIVRSIEKAGYFVEDIVLQPYASSEAVLTQDEKELGVVMVDIGGGTTDIIVFSEGGVRHTAVVAIGGMQVTNDVAIGLRAPIETAEEIKKSFGGAFAGIINETEEVRVKLIGDRPDRVVPKRIIAEIIQPRMEEIFEFVAQELRLNGLDGKMPSGVVVTGGASLIPGIEEVVEKVMKLPVRIGYPHGINDLVTIANSPMYATAVGLALYGAKAKAEGKSGMRFSSKSSIENTFSNIKEWFKALF
ncbi:MAG: cell division protein FtsA [Candidatus Firestonebacteria bacterium]|nr:cell division protein FtsA [Candidatus Firestonebacteria bacterium]